MSGFSTGTNLAQRWHIAHIASTAPASMLLMLQENALYGVGMNTTSNRTNSPLVEGWSSSTQEI
jgi:hypothetical protein